MFLLILTIIFFLNYAIILRYEGFEGVLLQKFESFLFPGTEFFENCSLLPSCLEVALMSGQLDPGVLALLRYLDEGGEVHDRTDRLPPRSLWNKRTKLLRNYKAIIIHSSFFSCP